MKVAEIPYLNSLPFYWKNQKNKTFKWIQVSPKKMGQLARKGEIDAGPISLVDSFALEEHFETLSDLGIAVKNSAKSVLLFSKKPIASLAGCTIGLTPHSVTSSKLLKFILLRQYKVDPNLRIGFKDSDTAKLLIGDEALKAAADRTFKKLFPYVIDLGEEWRQWQKLPFVFARWMVRKTVDRALKISLSKHLKWNLHDYHNNKKAAIKHFEKGKVWKYPLAEEYLDEFQYNLGKKEKKMITIFRKLA